MVTFEKDECGNIIDAYLDENERKWINKFRALLRSCPKGIELIIDDDNIEVYPAGTLSKHIGSKNDSHGICENLENGTVFLTSVKPGPLRPYSEGQ